MAERFTTLSNLTDEIVKITSAYRNAVLAAISDGVQEGAETFIEEAKNVSPEDTGEYKKSWVIKPMRKAKYVRYIGNTKKVKAHYTDSQPTIPLINILEYSKDKRARPHVGKAVSNSRDKIINQIINKIQKESK